MEVSSWCSSRLETTRYLRATDASHASMATSKSTHVTPLTRSSRVAIFLKSPRACQAFSPGLRLDVQDQHICHLCRSCSIHLYDFLPSIENANVYNCASCIAGTVTSIGSAASGATAESKDAIVSAVSKAFSEVRSLHLSSRLMVSSQSSMKS